MPRRNLAQLYRDEFSNYTAWRMNEWESIHTTIFSRRFKTAMVTFGVTLLATIWNSKNA